MARVVPPPPPEKFNLTVILDGAVYHVEARVNETLDDVRRAILDDLGRRGEDTTPWTLARPRGSTRELVEVEAARPVEQCREFLGFKFHLLRPGKRIDPTADLRLGSEPAAGNSETKETA